MRSSSNDLAIRVRGPFACFTRPEYSTERVSYPVITPPAAVGVLSSIFWKPEFDWIVSKIWVLAEPQWVSMTRNEVKSRASARSGGMDVLADRVQRHNLFLRDVDYVVFAGMKLRSHATDPPAKYRDQFRRRVERGAFFSPPYLGLREHTASFGPVTPDLEPLSGFTLPIGPMSLDLGYNAKGRTNPEFFDARVLNGVLKVPTPKRHGGPGAAP